jgi:hypothetical protein
MTVVVSDSFLSGSGLLTAHTPTVAGTSWVQELNSTGTTNWNLDAAGILASASVNTATWIATCRPNPTSVEYDITVKIGHWTASLDDPLWLVARFTDTSNYYVAGTYQATTVNKQIVKCVAGVKTQLVTAAVAMADGDTFLFQVRDATKKLFMNAVEMASTTDNALASAGSAGMGEGNIGSAAADDYATGSRIETFVLDQVAAAGASQPPPSLNSAMLSMLMH